MGSVLSGFILTTVGKKVVYIILHPIQSGIHYPCFRLNASSPIITIFYDELNQCLVEENQINLLLILLNDYDHFSFPGPASVVFSIFGGMQHILHYCYPSCITPSRESSQLGLQ